MGATFGRPIEDDDLVLLKPVGAEAKAEGGFSLGLQTWTLRNMDFDQMVAFAKEHGLTKIQSTDKHLNPRADWEDIKKKKGDPGCRRFGSIHLWGCR